MENYDHISMDYLVNAHYAITHSQEYMSLAQKTQMVNKITDGRSRNRLSHTQDVERIAEELARQIRPNDEKFIMMVRVAAAAHDLGHTALSHEGERLLNESVERVSADETYKNQRVKDFGREYANSMSSDHMIFRHEEHSVRVTEKVLRREGLELIPEIHNGILMHSSTSANQEPTDLISQIVKIADKIAYSISDVQDLRREGIITPENELNKPGNEFEKLTIEEMIKEYTEKSENGVGKISGGYLEHRRYHGYKRIADLTDSERQEMQNIEEELKIYRSKAKLTTKETKKVAELVAKRKEFPEKAFLTDAEQQEMQELGAYLKEKFPTMFSLYEAQKNIVLKEIHRKSNNKIKDEYTIRKMKAVIDYCMSRPSIIRDRMDEWEDQGYSYPEQVVYAIQTLTDDDVERIYETIEPELSVKMKAKFNFLVGAEKPAEKVNEIVGEVTDSKDEFGKRYKLIQDEIIDLRDLYYDRADNKFAKSDKIIRIRNKNDGEELTGTYAKMDDTATNLVVHKVAEFPLENASLKELIQHFRELPEEFSLIIDTPQLQIDTVRREMVFETRRDEKDPTSATEKLYIFYDEAVGNRVREDGSIEKLNFVCRIGVREDTTKNARELLHHILGKVGDIEPTKETICMMAYDALIDQKEKEAEEQEGQANIHGKNDDGHSL